MKTPSVQNDDERKVFFVHRTTIFDRNLEDLRRKGGTASAAAEKADKLIRHITRRKRGSVCKQFRFTRNGEYRIRYCKKHDLGWGYRLVFLWKGCHIVLLYLGSHDDCVRWIERNKGLTYETNNTTRAVRVLCGAPAKNDSITTGEIHKEHHVDEYEARLLSRIDDSVLRKIFSGICKN